MPEGFGDGDAMVRNHRQPFLANELYRTVRFTALTADLKFEYFLNSSIAYIRAIYFCYSNHCYRVTITPMSENTSIRLSPSDYAFSRIPIILNRVRPAN